MKHREVIVIGAGMAGILTAFLLREKGADVLLLEADTTASGQTGRTTAKITSQHGLKYSRLISKVGREKALMYARANETAIAEYERIISGRGIRCDFRRTGACLYSRDSVEDLRQEALAASSLGISACLSKETELPFPVKEALYFRDQAQFSPLPFILDLAGELDIMEKTKVIKIKGKRIIAEQREDGGRGGCSRLGNGRSDAGERCGSMMEFSADRIVVATHYPFKNIPGFYFMRQHQERSYVLALSGCRPVKNMYYGIDKNGLSVRQSGEHLLLGGGSHRTGERHNSSYDELRTAAVKYYPEATEAAHWSAQDCMPHDGIPFIGKYALSKPYIYVASGFQKWGMTSSMAAAMIIRDDIFGVENINAKVFSPQRVNLMSAAPDLARDIMISAKNITRGMISRVSSGFGSAEKSEAVKAGESLIKPPVCTHLGCQTVWNPDEETWDCPCHGSRFTKDGKLIDGPATKSYYKDIR